ncbi:MAG: molybdopterin molybdotransferase MoeA [Gammaproteobacteria bacterium]|nr:molybdopterin molybdotransferase MoeA [Gammaproteobacteria bacterium]
MTANSAPAGSLTTLDDAMSQLLKTLSPVSGSEQIAPVAASGRILALDFMAPRSVPPWDTSAMDGYAVRVADLDSAPKPLRLAQRIAAGSVGKPLEPGEVARIFTGAPMPPNANAVIMQENAEQVGDEVIINKAVEVGENLRKAGDDIKCGQTLFKAGHRCRPQDIGVLCSVGCKSVEVRRKLRVALLATGDELVRPGDELGPGQIYNSNAFTLSALLANLSAEVLDMSIVEDSFEATSRALKQAAQEADCVISIGGVSVGEEDHVRAALETLGSLELWKLAIKPGKPFASGKLFGADHTRPAVSNAESERTTDTQFFGLPGNPVSAFVTFVLLVRPLLMSMQGCAQPLPRALRLSANFEATASEVRQQYLRVSLASHGDGGVCLQRYRNQSSGAALSLSETDGLAIIPPGVGVTRGDLLDYLPFSELIY